MTECRQNKCSNEATLLVHWPGTPTELCGGCTQLAANLADVMGFKLTFEPNMANRVANLTESQKAEMAAYMMENDPE